ncbi:hypothetical protein FACS1894164_19130 [Spirochaetia bacterium]|nr:hypothetical protein FACS1894164_19130 [Spirochaetia bacterium]
MVFGIRAAVLDYLIKLPLFMDTMFALTVTFLIGPYCGIISAVFTHYFIK